MNEVDTVAAAFPKSTEGYPICGHCGEKRPGYFMLCVSCWNALSAFVKIEIIRAESRVEKARLILLTRPKAA